MKLGEWLVSKGFVTEEQLNDALVNQRTVERGKGLGKILIDAGIITKDTLKQFFKEEYSLECVDEQLIWNFLQDRNINNITEYAGVLGIAPDLLKNILIRDKFFVFDIKEESKNKRTTKIAIVPPINDATVNALKRYLNADFEIYGLLDDDFNRLVDFFSQQMAISDEAIYRSYIDENKVLEIKYSDKLDLNTFSGLLAAIFSIIDRNYGFRDVSDIHFVPFPYYYTIRIRHQGVLIELPFEKIPIDVVDEVINKIKVIGEMDIAERRRPQDGQMYIRYEGTLFSVRASTIGTIYDREFLEIRLLNRRSLDITLSGLGMLQEQVAIVRDALVKPFGIIATSGPTGAGKTTTLYTLLQELYSMGGKNILTIEDPVEYSFPGIVQTQTNVKANLTFTNILRSLFRMDPDVILVGEIRDHETMTTALDAAFSGHLVLSTIHANTAVATVSRFLNMGADPRLLSSALNLVISQRLIRKYDFENNMYKGRTGMFEIAYIDDATREDIANFTNEMDLQRKLISRGFKTYRDIAEIYINEKITTREEIERVLGKVDGKVWR